MGSILTLIPTSIYAQTPLPDEIRPEVSITNPPTPTTITNHVGTIVIQGTASDESGIAKVEAFAHTLPHDGRFNFQPAIPTSPGDWLKWSIELTIPDDQTYRVLVRAIDNTGNVNWAETTINSPPEVIPEVIPDEVRPKVSITNPSSPFEVTHHIGDIIIEGTSSDENGISKVEAFVHTLPFDDNFSFQPAIPTSPGDWSKWSIQLTIPDDQLYRVVVRSTDNTGNVNWTHTTINGQFDVMPDSVRPEIKITDPSTICTPPDHIGDIIIEGTSSDENGIAKIDGFAHTLPFDDNFSFQPAIPTSPGDWSKWSIQLTIPDDQPYRVVVRSTDNTGNVNWDNLLVNSPFRPESIDNSDENQNKTKHAFLYHTFTDGAYNLDSFYFFYSKYHDASPSEEITSDLNLLTGDVPYNYDVKFFRPLVDKVVEFDPDSVVSIIRDQDVHDGLIFTKNGANNFDTIFVLHDEYVTQTSYDNLRQFVKNGGVIVFLDSNIFYGEVIYDKKDCTVTLVKGHDWEFDGNIAKKSVSERYLEENTQWMGSNFIINDLETKVIFENNPFDYNHFEENKVTNKDAKILLDYKAKFPDSINNEDNPFIIGGLLTDESNGKSSEENFTVATYELQYGNGKVIMMGIYAETLSENPEFQKFFEKIILPRAMGEIYSISDEGKKFDLYWKMQNGKVTNIELDKEEKSLTIDLEISNKEKSGLEENNLLVTIPKSLIDAPTETHHVEFIVFVDDKQTDYAQTSDDIERSIEVPLSGDSLKVKFFGTIVLSENQTTPDVSTTQEDSNGGGCLIATAAYDSEMAPQVQSLREIRDGKVMTTSSGAAFISGFNQFYYSFSPYVADYERENPVFKEMVKIGITPLLATLSIMDYAETEQEILGYGIGVILMNAGMYFVAPVIIIFRFKTHMSRFWKKN